MSSARVDGDFHGIRGPYATFVLWSTISAEPIDTITESTVDGSLPFTCHLVDHVPLR